MLYLFKCGVRYRSENTNLMIGFSKILTPDNEIYSLHRYTEFCYTGNREVLTDSFYLVKYCQIGDIITWDGKHWSKIE